MYWPVSCSQAVHKWSGLRFYAELTIFLKKNVIDVIVIEGDWKEIVLTVLNKYGVRYAKSPTSDHVKFQITALLMQEK